MKLRTRIVTIAAIPVIVLGAVSLGFSSHQMMDSTLQQTYDGMHATAVAVSDLLVASGEGEYQIKDRRA